MKRNKIIKSLSGDLFYFYLKEEPKKDNIKSVYRWYLDKEKVKKNLTSRQILNSFKSGKCEIYQTRSEENGICFYKTILEVLNAIEKDSSIWKISFHIDDENGENSLWYRRTDRKSVV